MSHARERCLWCDEPLAESEEGCEALHVVFHRNCQLRSIYGSVGHILGRCSCFGGDEEDPPELTRRQAADAAVKMFNAVHRRTAH